MTRPEYSFLFISPTSLLHLPYGSYPYLFSLSFIPAPVGSLPPCGQLALPLGHRSLSWHSLSFRSLDLAQLRSLVRSL